MRTECFYLWVAIWFLALRDLALAVHEGNKFRMLASLSVMAFSSYRAWRTGQ